jgi:hypothetical protein
MILATVAILAGLSFGPHQDAAYGVPGTPCENLLFPGGAGTCPASAGAAVAQCCPCGHAQFSNHGQYVRCVAQATNALRRAGCVDASANRTLKSCAARSTCNKPAGFVTCCLSLPTECVGSVCERSDPPQTCTTSAECAPRTRCTLKSDTALCTAAGGTSGTGSCCAACGG